MLWSWQKLWGIDVTSSILTFYKRSEGSTQSFGARTWTQNLWTKDHCFLPHHMQVKDSQGILPLLHGRYRSVLDYKLQSSCYLSPYFSTVFTTVISSLNNLLLALLAIIYYYYIVFIPSVYILNWTYCFCDSLRTHKVLKAEVLFE